MCKIIKKNDHLNLQKKLIFRSDSIKNYLRKIIKLFK
jgi:hypothetical protein